MLQRKCVTDMATISHIQLTPSKTAHMTRKNLKVQWITVYRQTQVGVAHFIKIGNYVVRKVDDRLRC